MGWEQVWTIIGVIVPILGILAGWMAWALGRVDADVKKIESKMDIMAARMDARFESHSARLDQLYNMFVDLLMEKK